MSEVAAVGLAGVATGALTFVSFVDTRTYLKLASTEEEETIKKMFPIWWPNGRDLMAPLVVLGSIAHGVAYWNSGDQAWLLSGGLMFSIGPYTQFVLGEDIEGLRNADGKNVGDMTRRFCTLHHVRTVAACIVFASGLCTLSNRKM